MKLNKLKLSIIAIATIVASNTNAQTFYQCVPNGCPDGQYFDGVNCKKLCPNGYIVENMKCCEDKKKYIFTSSLSTPPVSKNGVYPTLIHNLPMLKMYEIILKKGDCITHKTDDGDKTVCWSCNAL